MVLTKLTESLQIVKRFSNEKELNSKNDFQDLLKILMEAIHEIEHCVDYKNYKTVVSRIKLCLLQLRYTINRISQILSDSYSKKSDILKLLSKKIYLCLKELTSIISENPSEKKVLTELNYHTLMSEVLLALSSRNQCEKLKSLVDDLLCSCLTIAKLSTPQDFMEISASCKNVLSASSDLDSSKDLDNTYITYHVKILERKINTAMLRLFLHVMSYPQLSLKHLIKKCGSGDKSEKYSEDLDDEISEFDLVCDRIGLVGNFALMSTEQESIKLDVRNCLANLEFCEESLVPACIDFYLDKSKDKRELLKYFTTEWKSQVLFLTELLDSIVDPAAFSVVVFEDLSDLIQNLKSGKDNSDSNIQNFYRRCLKLIDNLNKSPDCTLTDAFINDLKKSLTAELKINQNKTIFKEKVKHLDVILPLVDQISEYLNKLLNDSAINYDDTDLTNTTLRDLSMNDSVCFASDFQQQFTSEAVTKEWNNSYRTNECNMKTSLPNHFLEQANKNSPYVFTMYQKTPLRKKFKDNVTVSLEISKFLGQSFEA